MEKPERLQADVCNHASCVDIPDPKTYMERERKFHVVAFRSTSSTLIAHVISSATAQCGAYQVAMSWSPTIAAAHTYSCGSMNARRRYPTYRLRSNASL